MNQIKETWVSDGTEIRIAKIGPDGRDTKLDRIGEMTGDPYVAARRARLAAAAPEMARLLTYIGRGAKGEPYSSDGPATCGMCEREVGDSWADHASWCGIAAILRQVGALLSE